MKKTLTYSSLLVLALAITSCGKGNKAYDASGVFESTEVTVSAEGNGRIMSLDLQEGDRLEAGAVVGCIDTPCSFTSAKSSWRPAAGPSGAAD